MMMNIIPGHVPTLADVAAWAEQRRSSDDRRALARVEKLWDNVPLKSRRADIDAFDRQFPLRGFDPAEHKSEAAYKAWRRKVIAVLKDFLRQTAPTAVPVKSAVARIDSADVAWSELIAAIRKVCHGEEGSLFVQQRLLPIISLSREVIPLDLGPRDLVGDALVRIGAGRSGHDRASIIRALRNLNSMRSVPEIAALLPLDEYCLTPWPRKYAIGTLPEHLHRQIEAWLDASCGGEVDRVEGGRIGATSASDRSKKSVALRRYCEAALAAVPDLAENAPLEALVTPDIMVDVLRRWLSPTHLKPLSNRSITAYYSSVKTVAAHNGVDVSVFEELEKGTKVLQSGKREGKQMSPRVRKFCEGLLNSKALQTRLMTLHIRARRLAQSLLDRAEADDRELSKREVDRVRQLGAFAAYCAISTCGLPMRIDNLMKLRFRGPDANCLLPTKATPFARFLLPGTEVKNGKPIQAPLHQDRRNGLDTVLWYIKCVRPLFLKSEDSVFLFPEVRGTGAMDKKMFREWFKKISRSLGLPMVPHNFRHALASLLIHAYPGQYEAVAVLLGDTENTVRTYYAWVNKRVQIDAAQALVVGLANAA